MLRKLYLEGDMGEKYGRVAEVKATTVREVIQYLDANHSGVKEYLLDKHDKNIGFTIKIADEYVEDDRELLLPLDKGDIVITPVPVGSSGAIKTILGIILVVVGYILQATPFFVVGQWMIGAGLGLMAMGIAEMMAPDPATDNAVENKEGYLFQGAQQIIPEGNPVPVLYGELRVPGQPVTFNLRNSSEGFLSSTSNAGTMTTTADSEGNLFLVPAFVVEV
jgi:predicted phage tail protein